MIVIYISSGLKKLNDRKLEAESLIESTKDDLSFKYIQITNKTNNMIVIYISSG